MERNAPTVSLYELNNMVRRVVEQSLDGTWWLQAELSEVRENRGHCFVEFIQKDERSETLIAKARGQIWAGTWNMLRPYFEQMTGQRLSAGMQVLVLVHVTFHEAYGFSLNIVDIDPTYTLGDIARRRKEIIAQLEREGVLGMNKEVPLPRLLQRIAVISSATAAGYQDFCRQLTENPYSLYFHTRLFPAVMQGEAVESSVIAALNSIAAEMDQWDCVVIIRGGGSTADLTGFDTLLLAENVAQFPLPVLTGIGHERDDTVIDVVAHTRVKTPTAAAAFLVEHQKAELDYVERLADAVTRMTTQQLHDEQARLARLVQQLHACFHLRQTREKAYADQLLLRIANAVRLGLNSRSALADMQLQRLLQAVQTRLLHEQHRLELVHKTIIQSDPENLLKQGYSITRIDGKAVRDAATVASGSRVVTTTAHGEFVSIAQ